jgi:hypothetical protein
MDSALYFPYIRVPETPWFMHIILYWDRVATIAPDRFHARDQLTPFMNDLWAADRLELLSAHEASMSVRRLQGPFLESARARLEDLRRQPIEEWTRLHFEKGSYRLFSELERMGLAKRSHYEWVEVESSIAGNYMGMLARTVASSRGWYPVTDTPLTIGGPGDSARGAERLDWLRHASIVGALPVPSRVVPLSELLEFKEKHEDDLRRLRVALNNRLTACALIEDAEFRAARLGDVMSEIQDEVEALSAKMKERRWPGVALDGAGVVSVAGLAMASAAVGGGSPIAIGLAFAASLLGVAKDGARVVGNLRAPRVDPTEPLAYAALVQRL